MQFQKLVLCCWLYVDQLLKRYYINWASNLAVFLSIRDLTACYVNFHACCVLFVNEVVRKVR